MAAGDRDGDAAALSGISIALGTSLLAAVDRSGAARRTGAARAGTALIVAVGLLTGCALFPAAGLAQGDARRDDPRALADSIRVARIEKRAFDLDSLAERAERALAKSPEVTGPERSAVLDEIVEAHVQGTMLVMPRAIALAREAFAGPRQSADATALEQAAFRLGRVFRRAIQQDSTRAWFERALALQQARPHRVRDRAALLAASAYELSAINVFGAAESLAVMAESLWHADPSPDSLALARALLARARVRMRRTDMVAARELLERGASIASRQSGTTAEEDAWIEQSFVTVTGFTRSVAEAAAHTDSLLVRITRLPRLHPLALRSLAQARSALSDASQALRNVELGREGYARSLERYGSGHRETWNARISLAESFGHVGDFAAAAREARAAVDSIARGAPDELELRAYSHSVLGNIEMVSSQFPEAYLDLREAVRLRERAHGMNHFFVGYSLATMAEAAVARGRLAEARDSLARALEISIDKGVVLHTVSNYALLSSIEHRVGRDSLALAYADRCAALGDSIYGDGSLHAAEFQAARCGPLRATGRSALAFNEVLAMARLEHEAVRLVAASQPERIAGAMAEFRTGGLDAAIDIVAHDPVPPSLTTEAWDQVMRARALVFRVQAERRRRARAPGSAAGLDAEADRARADLARLLLERGAALSPAAWQQRIDHDRAHLEDLERRAFAGADTPPLAAAAVAALQRVVPEQHVLVAFARYTASRSSVAGSLPAEKVRRYAAFVLGAGGVRTVSLGDAEPIESAVARWSALAFAPLSGPPAARASALERSVQAGARVRTLLWDPLLSAIGNAERVSVVPDGAIAQVDFAALPDARGRYLVESGPLIARLTTEEDLLTPASSASNRGLLLVADPEFAPRDAGLVAMRAPGGDAFHPLPQTRIEADSVRSIWARGASAAPAELMLGRAADESAWRHAAPGHEILHFATHGFVVGADARSSRTPGQRGVGAVVESGAAEPPMLGAPDATVAGLAMSGAGGPEGAPAAIDGRLTGPEIESLDLEGVRWAVLSACRTGASRPDRPEPIQGLYRSFRLAGVRAVVMSLGPVDDTASREWMTRFYRAHLAGASDAAACVRAADRDQLAACRARGLDTHPSRWALFVAAGAP